MDTSQIKRFATEARNILMQGVAHRFTALGFNPDGTFAEEPQLFEGGATFMAEVVSTDFYHKWKSLQRAITLHSPDEVAEEAAYTWFNRLMAIRIMVKNELIPPVLQFESEGVYVPFIVTEARQGRLPDMSADELKKLKALLTDDSKTDEQFRMLITAFCHNQPVINGCFGHIADYTELLLPDNILAKGGFIDLVNHTNFITDADYQSPELIGWLYQFYISERKDAVFASFKNGSKAEAKDIPAATQIFTPNWIVKYMVQNTIGRIYLDNNPAERDIQKNWQYLVEPAAPTPDQNILHYTELEQLRFADLACGSGHILNECFDILYQLYINEGYTRRQAIENIFRHNLTGIDIDTRARQLAQFALLLKAIQKDRDFDNARLMPRVLDMPEPYPYSDTLATTLPQFLIGGNKQMVQEITDAITLMDQARNLGSIMKFNISDATRNTIAQRMQEYDAQPPQSDEYEQLKTRLRLILALTQKYSALVMNPPYMGSGNMNPALSNYVKRNYKDGKADLFAVFMLLATDRLADNGRYGMINMQSWMFLSSFEDLRRSILDNYHIDSLLHLGPRTFDEIGGEVVQNSAFVINKCANYGNGVYYRLVDGRNCSDKERLFLDAKNQDKTYYPNVAQTNFEKIPGCPIGYWVSEKIRNMFNVETIDTYAFSDGKNVTGDNERFLRLLWEVSAKRIGKGEKWMLQTKGGEARKWYGNTLNVIAWSEEDIKYYHKNKMSRVIKEYLWYKEGVTWSKICSSKPTFRLLREDSTYDEVNITPNKPENIYALLAILNTNMAIKLLNILNPTFSIQTENVLRLPFHGNNNEIDNLTKDNISISKQDWDAHETSWDFEENPLVAIGRKAKGKAVRLVDCVEQFEAEWSERFLQLHANEEELNRQFIEIYGLQDELTPEVPLSEITILQQGEISIVDNE